MYNYNNNQKSNVSKNKKMAGPNADRVNPYMAPGAYQQTPSMQKKTPDWMSAAGGTKPRAPMTGAGDSMTEYYKGLSQAPYHSQQKAMERNLINAGRPALQPSPSAITRSPSGMGYTAPPQNIQPGYSGMPTQPVAAAPSMTQPMPGEQPDLLRQLYPTATPGAKQGQPGQTNYPIDDKDHLLRYHGPNRNIDVTQSRDYNTVMADEYMKAVAGGGAATPVARRPEEILVAAPDEGVPPRPRPNGEVWGPPAASAQAGPYKPDYSSPDAMRRTAIEEFFNMKPFVLPQDGPQRATYVDEVAGAASKQPMYDTSPGQASMAQRAYESVVGMLPPVQRTLDEEMARGINPAPDTIGQRLGAAWRAQGATRDERERLQGMSQEQLSEYARANRLPMPSSMTPEQIAALDARTAAQLQETDALLADNAARGDAIAAQYAPRTEAMRQETAQLANRNNRAESALRGELGPRVPIDPSGPYARDSQGNFRDGRVNSTYSISGAQAERDAQTLAAMQADGDAYRAKVAEGDATMTMRPDDFNNRIEDPTQLKRDAQQFSADYQLYKRGGGTLNTRDYIKQRALANTLDPDLRRQLQYNYKMDLSSQGLEGVEQQDITTQRGAAMADAKKGREAEDTRRVGARETLNTQAARRGEIDRQIAADRNAGYYNTRPMREAQKLQQENMQRAMDYQREESQANRNANLSEIEARANAEAAAFQRQFQLQQLSDHRQKASQAKASIEAVHGPNADQPGTPANTRWEQWKANNPEPAMPFATQPPAQTQAPGAPPVGGQPPVAGGQPPAPPVSTPTMTASDFIAGMNDGAIPFNTNGTASEKMIDVAKAATKNGLDANGVVEVLRDSAVGIDLSDPVVARNTLDEITEAMKAHRMRAGSTTKGDDVKAAWEAGQAEIFKRYEPILNALKTVMDPKEVDDAVSNVEWFEEFAYKNALPYNPSWGVGGGLNAMSGIQRLGRGLFGG